jgi:hypothetical protein
MIQVTHNTSRASEEQVHVYRKMPSELTKDARKGDQLLRHMYCCKKCFIESVLDTARAPATATPISTVLLRVKHRQCQPSPGSAGCRRCLQTLCRIGCLPATCRDTQHCTAQHGSAYANNCDSSNTHRQLRKWQEGVQFRVQGLGFRTQSIAHLYVGDTA